MTLPNNHIFYTETGENTDQYKVVICLGDVNFQSEEIFSYIGAWGLCKKAEKDLGIKNTGRI